MKKIFILFVISVFVFKCGVFAQEERSNYGYIQFDRNDDFVVIEEPSGGIALMGTPQLPQKYDSRDYNYVSPIKAQGSGNTCWAFAAIGALETYLLKNYAPKDENGVVIDNTIYDFSENHMQYMQSYMNNNPLGFVVGTGVNSGGNSLMSSAYFLNDYGPVNESKDPYTNINSRDYSSTKNMPKGDWKVDSIATVPQVFEVGISDEKRAYIQDAKELIYKYGSALSGVCYKAQYITSDLENFYCGKAVGVNHQILLVGWDDTYPKENFVCSGNSGLPAEDGAFIVKNSHGASANGGDGYFYLSYCDYNVLSDIMAVTKVTPRNEKQILYNYDPFGYVLAMSYGTVSANPVKYGNVFERKTENEILTGVSLYAYPGITYDIYLINSSLSDCTMPGGGYVKFDEYSPKLIYNDFKAENYGYYTVYLDEAVSVDNEKFAVMVEASYAGVIPFPIERNVNLSNGNAFISKAAIEEKQSFYIHSDYYTGVFSDGYSMGGNFCVKAITETEEPYAEFEFANFTGTNGIEKTEFAKGETVVVIPALNGVNLENSQIIVAGYLGDKLDFIRYKNFTNGNNHFTVSKIPDYFGDLTFKFYAWGLDGLKPLCNPINVGK